MVLVLCVDRLDLLRFDIICDVGVGENCVVEMIVSVVSVDWVWFCIFDVLVFYMI